ncbi:MAG: hypothetical protein E6H09_06065 [Bacteroidetes bacterium]|nr:MAG: hypothetical protein E6H09_06065 [Bacteroidota bacterium]
MKFRKKHKQESEVYTDSLNDILFILLMLFLITATLANPNIVKVNQPRGEKDTKAKQNITVSIDKNQNFFVGQTKTDRSMIDTVLVREINKMPIRLLTMGKCFASCAYRRNRELRWQPR